MGKQKHTAGVFVRIALADGSFGYGRLLESPYAAFYNHRTTSPDSELDRIASKRNFRRCTLFDTAGNERAAEPQECMGLERAAVWEQSSVEQRLLDAFQGRPNADEEHLKVRLR